jgi:hypothetical protein
MRRRPLIALLALAVLAATIALPGSVLAQTSATPASTAAPPSTAAAATATAPASSTTPGTTAPASRSGTRDSTAAIALLAVVGLLLLVAAVLWGMARWSAWEPRWWQRWRHATGEAAWRSSAAWAEFRDWVRLGR